jgi:N-methylhydantoinase A/oxoprolinase/acetone carboxylase beta subunit
MGYSLGVDTGGTYTDAVVIDAEARAVLGSAKALTTRDDLAIGIGGAVDAALAAAGVGPQDIALVSLSTTLATNALVEGQGGRVALVAIGFTGADLARAGLTEAMGGDPVIVLAGGHGASGGEAAPLDEALLASELQRLGSSIAGFAVTARFATRNPAHEMRARDIIAAATGLPVTCGHELSARLNGPKRALTAVLNARLIGKIATLVAACERHLAARGIAVPLMVVRGDGALISAQMVRERPIETILSGPAASLVGAHWLTGEQTALVSDIGGTTTDVALLKHGLPEIDAEGALVGGHRTMVEAVAMRTTGLGGDSEVHLQDEGLAGGMRLGPRRVLPLCLLAEQHPDLVHAALDRALARDQPGDHDGRFVIRMAGAGGGLPARDAALLERIAGALPLSGLLKSRLEMPALDRLVARGLVMLAGVTPTDAAHVLGLSDAWDASAARKGIALMNRKRAGNGLHRAPDAEGFARLVIDQVTAQTRDTLLEAAFAEDPGFRGSDPRGLAHHPLTRAGLAHHGGIIEMTARIGVPVIGLGASAPTYYPAVGAALGARMILPAHAGVANAIGAVVGQISQRATGTVTSDGAGRYTAHLASGPALYPSAEAALAALETALRLDAHDAAIRAGAAHVTLATTQEIKGAEVEGREVFVEATLTVTASGRPRMAH